MEGHLRSPDTTIFCEPVKCELPAGVERIMISFGPSLGDAEGVGGARPRMVGFVVSVRGLLRPTSEKGIAYLQGDLVYPYDLVSDVDQYDIDSRGRVRKKVYRRIDSHWYVYFQPL